MRFSITKKWLLLAALILVFVAALVVIKIQAPRLPALPVKSEILAKKLIPSSFNLRNLTLGGQGSVYGARGKVLHQIVDDGSSATPLYTFEHNISAIHERTDGLLIVATDDDHWDPKKPCRIYRSFDGGAQFELVKTIQGGTALWWSIDSDQQSNLYLAEYGPQQKGMSKTLWQSSDDGEHWKAIYEAPNEDKTHLHRIAVDPYTDDLWLTIGDGKNRSMLRSTDHGENWQQIKRLQSTAVAFGPQAIYWGKDKKGHPGVLRFDRESERFSNYFNPLKFGNYGGSIYDMLRLPSGELIVPFMKYPDQAHVASVWIGQEKNWQPMLYLASEQGKGAGMETIAGPDKAGWIYLPAYQFKVAGAKE